MANDAEVRDAIAAVVGDLLAREHAQRGALLLRLAGIPAMAAAIKAAVAGDAPTFRDKLVVPLETIVDAVVDTVNAGPYGRFMLREFRFVDRHLQAMFRRWEGLGCSGDKARTVYAQALRYFRFKTPIVFDRNQEYVFHLPTRILNDQASIVEFIEALMDLHHGKPDRYIRCLAAMGAAAEAE